MSILIPTTRQEAPLGDAELHAIDAYWRAANYLSVGQIYLLDNPLLREPLRLEHVKPRLLGHWGTTPGLNFVYAHLNRVIARARPATLLYVAGPGPRRARAWSPTPTWRAPTARSTRTSRRDERGHAAAVPPVLLPGRHPEPRRPGDARLDPRGRRARLLAGARLRRGVRQPRPARLLRGRRRRGRDRAAGRQLALEQVPRPRPRRRRAADPAPQRLQDRQPDGPRAHPRARSCARCSRATATSRASSRATTPPRCTSSWPRRWTRSLDEIAAHPGRRARGRQRPSARAGR